MGEEINHFLNGYSYFKGCINAVDGDRRLMDYDDGDRDVLMLEEL